jgi:hypothetical protein
LNVLDADEGVLDVVRVGGGGVRDREGRWSSLLGE